MKEIGAFEAKNRFGSLLDLVEQGEEVVITRRGKVVARLVPGRAGRDRNAVMEAARRIESRRAGATLGGLRAKDLVSEGRR